MNPAKPGWNQKPPVQVPVNQVGSARGRVNIIPAQYDLLIRQQGVRVKVFRSFLCPGVKSIDGGEHEIDCPLCSGNGFVDVKPLDTMAFIQSQALEKVHRAEGYWDGNSVAATFLQGVELQYFTLVQLPDFTDIFFERVKRQSGPVDVLKYRALRVNVLMDSKGAEYLEGSDFALDANGSIRWNAGKGPERGSIYSIHYEAAQQFRAIKAMHVNRFVQSGNKSGTVQMVKANEQWMLQREFLVRRKDYKGNDLSPNLIRDPDEE